MKTYEELEQEFKGRVAWLQKRCPHVETKWGWVSIPGFFGERKICLRCQKVLDAKYRSFSVPTTSSSMGSYTIWDGRIAVGT